MERITSIQQLDIKKIQLEKKREALKGEIEDNWNELNEFLRPDYFMSRFILTRFRNLPFIQKSIISLFSKSK